MTWIKTKTWSWNRRLALLGAAAAWLVAGSAGAIPHTITSFEPFTTTPVPKTTWYESDAIAGAGTASIVDLTGAPGTLDSGQPLPIGAALLTTTLDPADKAEVGVTDAYGIADSVFNDATLSLSYAYYKDTLTAGNPSASAAPALKLTVTNPVCTGTDCFGTLVYEPTWNSGVVNDTWTAVSITEDTGLFWWTGGFGEPSGAGGPPLMTLADWAATFSTGTEAVDWAGASLFALSVGVGTTNLSQTGYFDDVTVAFTGFSEEYDFEPIPEPATAALCLAGLLGLAWQGRRRPTAATPLR